MKADQHISDVIGVLTPENEPCCRILYRMKMANQVGRQPSQQTVTVKLVEK